MGADYSAPIFAAGETHISEKRDVAENVKYAGILSIAK